MRFFYAFLRPSGLMPEGLFCLPVDQRGRYRNFPWRGRRGANTNNKNKEKKDDESYQQPMRRLARAANLSPCLTSFSQSCRYRRQPRSPTGTTPPAGQMATGGGSPFCSPRPSAEERFAIGCASTTRMHSGGRRGQAPRKARKQRAFRGLVPIVFGAANLPRRFVV